MYQRLGSKMFFIPCLYDHGVFFYAIRKRLPPKKTSTPRPRRVSPSHLISGTRPVCAEEGLQETSRSSLQDGGVGDRLCVRVHSVSM